MVEFIFCEILGHTTSVTCSHQLTLFGLFRVVCSRVDLHPFASLTFSMNFSEVQFNVLIVFRSLKLNIKYVMT